MLTPRYLITIQDVPAGVFRYYVVECNRRCVAIFYLYAFSSVMCIEIYDLSWAYSLHRTDVERIILRCLHLCRRYGNHSFCVSEVENAVVSCVYGSIGILISRHLVLVVQYGCYRQVFP